MKGTATGSTRVKPALNHAAWSLIHTRGLRAGFPPVGGVRDHRFRCARHVTQAAPASAGTATQGAWAAQPCTPSHPSASSPDNAAHRPASHSTCARPHHASMPIHARACTTAARAAAAAIAGSQGRAATVGAGAAAVATTACHPTASISAPPVPAMPSRLARRCAGTPGRGATRAPNTRCSSRIARTSRAATSSSSARLTQARPAMTAAKGRSGASGPSSATRPRIVLAPAVQPAIPSDRGVWLMC